MFRSSGRARRAAYRRGVPGRARRVQVRLLQAAGRRAVGLRAQVSHPLPVHARPVPVPRVAPARVRRGWRRHLGRGSLRRTVRRNRAGALRRHSRLRRRRRRSSRTLRRRIHSNTSGLTPTPLHLAHSIKNAGVVPHRRVWNLLRAFTRLERAHRSTRNPHTPVGVGKPRMIINRLRPLTATTAHIPSPTPRLIRLIPTPLSRMFLSPRTSSKRS